MKAKWILTGTVVVLLAGVGWFLTRPGGSPEPAPADSAQLDPPSSTVPAPVNPPAPATVSEPIEASTTSAPADIPDRSAPADPAQMAAVRGVIEELAGRYSSAGSVGWDEARALIVERERVKEGLVERLAQLGPGGARAIGTIYPEAGNTRARIVLIQALGKLNDPQASLMLEHLLAQPASLSVRKEMVLALGRRSEPDADRALSESLTHDPDPQLRFASAQALSGRGNVLSVLAGRITSEPSSNVRAELIRSVGLVGNPEALKILTAVAQTPVELPLRQTAIRELGRSFGQQALPVLEDLLADREEAIRSTAVTALARLENERARELLSGIAVGDPSAALRTRAQGLLATSPTLR